MIFCGVLRGTSIFSVPSQMQSIASNLRARICVLLTYDLFELCSFSGDFRISNFGGVKLYYLLLLHVCTVMLLLWFSM